MTNRGNADCARLRRPDRRRRSRWPHSGARLCQAGFDVVCSGAGERTGRGRTVAMLDGRSPFLTRSAFGRRSKAQPRRCRALRIIDDTGTLFPPRPVEFLARRNRPRRHSAGTSRTTGWRIRSLSAEAPDPGVERVASSVAAYDFAAERAAGAARRRASRLSRPRPRRRRPGLESAPRRRALSPRPPLRQSALTVHLVHRLPHRDFSTEFHTRGGPFTLVPLPASATAANRSSLVWVMADSEARRRAALNDDGAWRRSRAPGQSLLGAMRIEGGRAYSRWSARSCPESSPSRLALIGDAAHAFPPIGAQGLNLGLRDVEAIFACAAEAADAGRDIGGREALQAYERARRSDIAHEDRRRRRPQSRAASTRFAPLDFVRGAGLAALAPSGRCGAWSCGRSGAEALALNDGRGRADGRPRSLRPTRIFRSQVVNFDFLVFLAERRNPPQKVGIFQPLVRKSSDRSRSTAAGP